MYSNPFNDETTMNRLLFPIVLLAALTLSSCTRREEYKPTDLVTFPLKGEVVAIDTVKHRITVAHEEIPNYMDAMTMPFKVKNLTLLKSAQVGDSIQGILAVSRVESWLDTFVVIGKGEPISTQLMEGSIMSRVLKEGDTPPPVELTNQDGKKIHLGDFKGKVVVLTFIYTRCPLPDFCIRMSNHFAQLQKILQGNPSLKGQWHLVSVSFDPKFDTPKVLKQYGITYSADFATWDFATADQATIMELGDGFGLTVGDDEGGLLAHNLRTVLLDKAGKIVNVIEGNEWTPEDVAEQLGKLAK
jgi:protein SCO1